MRADPIQAMDFAIAEVTAKTQWIFITLTTAAGLRGTGEATLNGQDAAVADAASGFAPAVFAMPDAVPANLPGQPLASLARAAAFSAIDQALWDIAACRAGVTLAAALGPVRRSAIPLYANINRRTLDRSPSGFGASARAALAAGHEAIKIAPFDEATPEARRRGELAAAIEPGLRRIEAVRAAIGPHRRLMVDCHWRLDEAAAARVVTAAADIGVHWVECPLPETGEQTPAIVRLRTMANSKGMLLAGCEQGIGQDGFLPFIRAGAYDVMMPDVKYVGGLAVVLQLAETMRRAGVAFSPHNPTGPVCHAASMHVSAVVADLHSLESQFDETPLFDALAGQGMQAVTSGNAKLSDAPGLGMHLQPVALGRCRGTAWTAKRENAGYAIDRESIVHGRQDG